jgi:hypothetical protein
MIPLDLHRPEWWRQEFRDLSISSEAFRPAQIAVDALKDAGRSIFDRGYSKGRQTALLENAAPLAKAAGRLAEMNLPITFLFLFDQAWQSFYSIHDLLAHVLGADYNMLPAFWAWHIGPGGSGWAPHRDRGRRSLAPDGSPRSITLWIPISEASLENSCIHILPSAHDRTYNTENESIHDAAWAQAVSLPAIPGDFLCWNQALLHWGSKAGPCSTGPRVSMSAEFQCGDDPPFDRPVIQPLASITFDERLLLVAVQMLRYQHMYALSPELKKMAEGIYGNSL